MLVVENHLPKPCCDEGLINSVAGEFPHITGKLIVTQPQNSSDWVLDLALAGGSRATEVLMMWSQMALSSPEQLAKVLRETITKMVERISVVA